MANVKKALRVKDSDIIRLNHVGLPLKAIGEILGCHYATVTNRMKAMKLAPVDTRHSFMEDIFKSLSTDQQEWLSNYLYNNQISIKSFLSFLIQQAYAGAIELPVGEPLPQEEVLDDVPEEIVAEAEDLPIVEPEYAHDGDEPDAQEDFPEAMAQADLEEEEEPETLRTASLFR